MIIPAPSIAVDTTPAGGGCDACATAQAGAAAPVDPAPVSIMDRSATLSDLATLFGVLSTIFFVLQRGK